MHDHKLFPFIYELLPSDIGSVRFSAFSSTEYFGVLLTDVTEEHLVAWAQVIAALNLGNGTGRGDNGSETLQQTVLGTTAKAEVGHVAVQTLTG